MISFRFTFTLVVLLALIFLPYWVYLPLLGGAMIIFPFFWEGIVLALLIDVLYGGGINVSQLPSTMSFWATLLLIILLPLRERIRINA